MSDLEIKKRILDKATELFLKFGYSKVTMNEIAAELGMSKKTLYHYFASKEEVVMAAVNSMQDETARKVDGMLANQDIDFIEKLFMLLDLTGAYHSKITGHFLLDVQKSVPNVAKCCGEFLNERIPGVMGKLLREGMEKNLLRKDVDERILLLIKQGAFEAVIKPEVLSQLPYSAREVLGMVGSVLFQGILTEEGRKKVSVAFSSRQVSSPVS